VRWPDDPQRRRAGAPGDFTGVQPGLVQSTDAVLEDQPVHIAYGSALPSNERQGIAGRLNRQLGAPLVMTLPPAAATRAALRAKRMDPAVNSCSGRCGGRATSVADARGLAHVGEPRGASRPRFAPARGACASRRRARRGRADLMRQIAA
jgi:hypothetical protein